MGEKAAMTQLTGLSPLVINYLLTPLPFSISISISISTFISTSLYLYLITLQIHKGYGMSPRLPAKRRIPRPASWVWSALGEPEGVGWDLRVRVLGGTPQTMDPPERVPIWYILSGMWYTTTLYISLYNLHHRSIGVQNWGFYFLDPPKALGNQGCLFKGLRKNSTTF